MNKPTISVIVPVYNAESYLSRCVDSLLIQTYQDFEIILVNDGSTDSSGAICDEYAQKDDRIRVIHQSNSGVAAARQQGIDAAQGEYSIHADPDDWMEHTALEELYLKAMESNADITICDFMVDYSDKSDYVSQGIDKCDAKGCLYLLMYGIIHGSLWNKLIRTQLYKEHNIRFIEGINHCEDYLICVQLFLHNVKIAYLPKALYHYDQICNNNSITRTYTKNTLSMRLSFINALKKILRKRYKAFAHAATVVALECHYHNILTPREFAKTFRSYRKYFLRAHFPKDIRKQLFWDASFACFKSTKIR